MLTRRTVIFLAPAAALADLERKTLDGYVKYVESAAPSIEQGFRANTGYLWVDRDPSRLKDVRAGKVVAERVKTPEVDDGLIHHWVGAVFMTGITLAQMLKVDQDYNRHKILYAPDVMDSKLLARQGNHFRVYLRLRKHKVITVILDTEHEIDYIPIDANRVFSKSACRKVQEVKDAGTPQEKVLPVGEGTGFLWAMDSFWRLAERDGGLYAECDALTLTRDLPLGMNTMLGPIIRSVSEEALTTTLEAKRRSVGAKQ